MRTPIGRGFRDDLLQIPIPYHGTCSIWSRKSHRPLRHNHIRRGSRDLQSDSSRFSENERHVHHDFVIPGLELGSIVRIRKQLFDHPVYLKDSLPFYPAYLNNEDIFASFRCSCGRAAPEPYGYPYLLLRGALQRNGGTNVQKHVFVYPLNDTLSLFRAKQSHDTHDGVAQYQNEDLSRAFVVKQYEPLNPVGIRPFSI